MNSCEAFNAEVAPAIVLLDVQGRRNPVLTGDRAEQALVLADMLQELGGTGRITQVPPADGAEGDGEPVLLHYRSHRERATKGEIARAASIVATSQIRERDCDMAGGETLYVTGSRAVVYPERPTASGKVVFLVSSTVWYNNNRATVNFPYGEDQVTLFLDDINGRLTDGVVSIAY
jgi:hypothetical protein